MLGVCQSNYAIILSGQRADVEKPEAGDTLHFAKSLIRDNFCCAATGPRSSALVGGYTAEHKTLETQLHTLKETEDALLFPSGFAANQVELTATVS